MVCPHIRRVPAVDVQQKARPATHDEPTVPNKPARGKDMRRPIPVGYRRFSRDEGGKCSVVEVVVLDNGMDGGGARFGRGFPRLLPSAVTMTALTHSLMKRHFWFC